MKPTEAVKKIAEALGYSIVDGVFVHSSGKRLKLTWEATEQQTEDLKHFHGLDAGYEFACAVVDQLMRVAVEGGPMYSSNSGGGGVLGA